MNLLLAFNEAAKKAFKDARIKGDFLGINPENERELYFIYMDLTGRVKKSLWKEAPGCWEGIYRTMTRQVEKV